MNACTQHHRDGITTEYWRTYYEWRMTYGLEDGCMDELLAAIRIAIEQEALTMDQQEHLTRLKNLIETERRLAFGCAA